MTEPAVPRREAKVPVDLRWLLGLLTLVAVVMYSVVVAADPDVRRPLVLTALTVLLVVHLLLHWLLFKIDPHSGWLHVYILVQGILFFAIALLARSPNLIFPLFAGLLGEAIGSLGWNRRGILAVAYDTLLLIVSIILLFDRAASGWMIVGTAAIVVTTALYTVLYKRQVEARARAQSLLQDLEAAHRQLGEYAARVEELTTAAERQRMARELHDTLSQGLAGLTLQLEAVEAHLAGGRGERALEIVGQAKEQARETLADSRRAIRALRQTGPPDLGEAVRQETEHFSASTGIPCTVAVSLPSDLADTVSEAALRAVSEGLTNIARHAQARHASLRIATIEAAKELEIEIGDDGVGFDPASVEAGHYGLLGMRERVQLAGGRLEVRSAPGEGTQIVIRFPLESSADE
jgi:NarL family two-component system sensor histidine kinase YdfH